MRRHIPETTRREWVALLGVWTAGLTGCLGDEGNGGSGPEHYENNEYISATGTDAETLVHHRIASVSSNSYVSLTMDGAYGVTADVEVSPFWMDLEQADDEGRVYEAALREGLEWSDPYGSMAAEDWVYHIKNIHQGENNWAGP